MHSTKAKAEEVDQLQINASYSRKKTLAINQVSSILLDSIKVVNRGVGEEEEDDDVTSSLIIQEAISLLDHLIHQAGSISFVAEESDNNIKSGSKSSDGAHNIINSSSHSDSESIYMLACYAVSAIESLHGFIQRVNNQTRNKKSKKKSTGKAWNALQGVVNSALLINEGKMKMNDDADANSLAVVSIGIVLSLGVAVDDVDITKMIASAILPGDDHMVNNNQGKKYQKQSESTKTLTTATTYNKSNEYSMARVAVLRLLQIAIIDNNDNDVDATKGLVASDNADICVDLQIVAKMESGFGIGRLFGDGDDVELRKSVSDLIDFFFGSSSTKTIDNDSAANDEGEFIIPHDKEQAKAVLSLVAAVRPWDCTDTDVEALVKIAAEMDLWYAAELLCDAAIESVVSSGLPGSVLVEKTVIMATSFPCGEESEAIMKESQTTSSTSLSQDTIAHRATRALVDIALDDRLYRRADVFASKYYYFCGPNRYAQARFLHACDTITKVIKQRQVQIIDKQIDRVDEMVERVIKDLPSDTESFNHHGDDIVIETMSEHIREFCLRRLRASNMHAAATRLAKLWGIQYNQDPLQLMQEMEKRRETYLQWDDAGCPGNSSGDGSSSLPIPELISDSADLLSQFPHFLENERKAVGFDCEWHDSVNYCTVLQISTTTNCLLLDIPALTATEDGCIALKDTVGRLFSIQHMIGFGCKDDIKRLRASPCVTTEHWFPKQLLVIDLRNLIVEVCPTMRNLGLSRGCEAFLGKQLDKSEQCSDWLARPLSPEQREYAALDAWACSAIYEKIRGMK